MSMRSSAPRTKYQQNQDKIAREIGNPSDQQERISYGMISAVNYNSGQVKVKLLTSDGKIGEEIAPGYLPLATPLSEIHLLWGALREGLVVRIYWRGKGNYKDAIIEVIGDEEHRFLTKEPEMNELATGPWTTFLGGMP